MNNIHGQYLFSHNRVDLIRWPEIYALEGAKRLVHKLEEDLAKWMLNGPTKGSEH